MGTRLWNVAAWSLGLILTASANAGTYYNTAVGLGGLANYWDMNETSGDALDSVGGLTLTAINGTGRATDATLESTFAGIGSGNRVATFDASLKQGLHQESPSVLAGSSSASMSYFVRLSGSPTLAVHMGSQRTNGLRYGYTVKQNSGGGNLDLYATRPDNTQVQLASGQNVAGGAWHHIVLTYNYDPLDAATSRFAFYLDGVLKASAPTNSPLRADGTDGDDFDFLIGYDIGDASRHLNGSIDEVALFGRALSANEVSQLFNAAVVPEPAMLSLLLAAGAMCRRR